MLDQNQKRKHSFILNVHSSLFKAGACRMAYTHIPPYNGPIIGPNSGGLSHPLRAHMPVAPVVACGQCFGVGPRSANTPDASVWPGAWGAWGAGAVRAFNAPGGKSESAYRWSNYLCVLRNTIENGDFVQPPLGVERPTSDWQRTFVMHHQHRRKQNPEVLFWKWNYRTFKSPGYGRSAGD